MVLFCLTERELRATGREDSPSRMALTSRPTEQVVFSCQMVPDARPTVQMAISAPDSNHESVV